jgi:hypothetical protein
MAISIPIVSEFDGKGIAKAQKEFAQLEGAGAKANYAIKKAALPAAAALGGLGAALFDATKGAMEDAAAQKQLSLALKNSTGATDQAVAATEDWISAQGQALGVTDDDLRPALAKLARQTHDVATAQKAASLAMDISAATGKDLSTVSDALAKAYGGNLNALSKLSPELKQVIKDGASLDEVMKILEGTFGGAATEAANTAQGGFKRLSLALAETKESIGAALLPTLEKLLPRLQTLATWAQNNPEKFTQAALAIGAIATATMAVNAAMAVNPYVLAAAGVVALAVAFERLFQALDKISKIGGIAARLISSGVLGGALNIGKPILNRFGGNDKTATGLPQALPSVVAGAVNSFIPSGVDTGGVLKQSVGGNTVNINVNGGDPQAVVDALRRYQQLNGSVPIRVAG